MLPIAICDDEPMHRQRTAAVLQEKIAGYGPALRLFASSAELLNAVETEGYAPRIAVLDIQMQEMDGISLARELNRRLPQCAVIFLTAFSPWRRRYTRQSTSISSSKASWRRGLSGRWSWP